MAAYHHVIIKESSVQAIELPPSPSLLSERAPAGRRGCRGCGRSEVGVVGDAAVLVGGDALEIHDSSEGWVVHDFQPSKSSSPKA